MFARKTAAKNLYLRARFRAIDQIKRPAFSVECKTDIRNNATTGHGIENKVYLPTEIQQMLKDSGPPAIAHSCQVKRLKFKVPKVPKVKGTKMTITCFRPVFIGLKMGFPILSS